MQTTTRPTRRTAVKRAPQIPFPELPSYTSAPQALYYRAAWLRGVAMCDAMRRFVLRRTFSDQPRPMRLAAITCERLLEQEAKQDLRYLIEAGGILYAWLPEGAAS